MSEGTACPLRKKVNIFLIASPGYFNNNVVERIGNIVLGTPFICLVTVDEINSHIIIQKKNNYEVLQCGYF